MFQGNSRKQDQTNSDLDMAILKENIKINMCILDAKMETLKTTVEQMLSSLSDDEAARRHF